MQNAAARCADRDRSDEELFADYRAGDDDAFEQIYERRFGELTAFLRRRLPLGAQDDAEDLAETALYKAASQAHTFDPARGAFRPWLYAIATNLRRDLIRSWARRLERLWTASPRDCAEVADPRASAEERMLREDGLTRALAATDRAATRRHSADLLGGVFLRRNGEDSRDATGDRRGASGQGFETPAALAGAGRTGRRRPAGRRARSGIMTGNEHLSRGDGRLAAARACGDAVDASAADPECPPLGVLARGTADGAAGPPRGELPALPLGASRGGGAQGRRNACLWRAGGRTGAGSLPRSLEPARAGAIFCAGGQSRRAGAPCGRGGLAGAEAAELASVDARDGSGASGHPAARAFPAAGAVGDACPAGGSWRSESTRARSGPSARCGRDAGSADSLASRKKW